MDNKNTPEKGKQDTLMKIINTSLCVGIITSIAINIYEYSINNLESEINIMEIDIESLENENTTLDKDIGDKQTELSGMSTQIEELNNNIEDLEADNKSLSDSLEELQNNNTNLPEDEETDIANMDLTDEEQAMIDEIVAEIMAEYKNTSSSTTQTSGYVSVDAPVDDGILPPSTFGQGDYSGLEGGQVY